MEHCLNESDPKTPAAMTEDETFSLPQELNSVLKIENKSFRQLPENIFQDPKLQSLIEITLTRSEIEVLPQNFSSNLQNLRSLNLEGNKLCEFPQAISKLRSLETLNVSHNNLSALSNEVGSLLNLEKLDLSNNKITEVSSNVVSLINLKVLKLSHNNISILPDEIAALLSLRVLDVSNNSLLSLPDSVNNLKALTYLDVSHNDLSSLPDCLDLLVLGTLILSHNKFANIPDCVTFKLMSLNVLDISFNFLHFFDIPPKCVAKLVKLVISNNMFTDIPSWLFGEKCRSLKYVDISFNKTMIGISKISPYIRSGDTVGVSSTLRYLVANNCCFSSSSVEFLYGLKALEIMDVSNKMSSCGRYGNILFNFPSTTLSTCIHLKKINVSGTAMNVVPDNVGNLSAKLEVLDMSLNELSSLPDAFCKLVSLTKLDLSHNQLLKLPADFGALTTLKELRLNMNKLDNLPDSLMKLKNLQLLDLYDNLFFELPSFLLSISTLEALDVGFNCFRVNDEEKSNEEFFVKYESMKSKLRSYLPDDLSTSRQDKCKYEYPDEADATDENQVEELDCDEDESDFETCDDQQEACHPTVENLVAEPEENWDEITDDNFVPREIPKYPPKDRSYGPALLVYETSDPEKDEFCPATYHSMPVRRARKQYEKTLPVAGQFDDAD